MNQPMTLHNFAFSSASHRVRIGLHFKGIPFEYVSVPIMAQETEAFVKYRALNPQALVPTLIHGDVTLTQSLAILEYLEEVVSSPALLPTDVVGRARVRSIALAIVSEIQPLQNLRVFNHVRKVLGHDEKMAMAWRHHWVGLGLDALEKQLSGKETGAFCHGDSPTIADCCLIPQIESTKRWGMDIEKWPIIARIGKHADTLPAFRKAAPENQPDFPPKK